MEKKDILLELIKHYTCGNKEQFAKMVGTSPQNISTWISRNTFNVDKILTKCVGINPSYILTGEGPMLKNNTPARRSSYFVSDDIEDVSYTNIVDEIPVVPAAIVKVPDTDVLQYVQHNDTDMRRVLRGNVIADMCARVKDLAMYPEIQVGDEIYLKEIKNCANLANGNVYVVDTYSQGMLIRMLYDKGSYFMAKARAERFADFKIIKSDIIRIYAITLLRRISF